MEVSTRCGIDPVGVWAAWGMSCLQLNNYPTAREKFAKCLKVKAGIIFLLIDKHCTRKIDITVNKYVFVESSEFYAKMYAA